jgi:hypothetical protein
LVGNALALSTPGGAHWSALAGAARASPPAVNATRTQTTARTMRFGTDVIVET